MVDKLYLVGFLFSERSGLLVDQTQISLEEERSDPPIVNYISYHVHQERISYTRDSKHILLPNRIFLCELLLRFVSYGKKKYIGLGFGV